MPIVSLYLSRLLARLISALEGEVLPARAADGAPDGNRDDDDDLVT